MWTEFAEKMRSKHPILRLLIDFWYVVLIVLVIIVVALAIIFTKNSEKEVEADAWTSDDSLIFTHTVSFFFFLLIMPQSDIQFAKKIRFVDMEIET